MGSERMSCEGQLSANMQVDDEASVNWGASLGEGSAQGNIVVQSQSHPDLTDLLSRGCSTSCSPTPRGQTKPPNIVIHCGRSPTRRQKPLGVHISKVKEKLKRDFDVVTSQMQANLVHATIIMESGQSITQAAFQQMVERKKEIEHLHITMQAAMQEYATVTKTSTTQQLNTLADKLIKRMGAVVEESQTFLLAKQNEELVVLKNRIYSLQQFGDVCEGTILCKELSALQSKVENARLES